eukprot:CAMPEP_0172643840 /NCGR_PEP_ID=MMETSP1068-20121228/238597_1 /TAXON_ID=35684 /ORGANISM="Pseudopedinella elastica, Strain CCMP716" /LENGTH=271 /DNA_ID=CAMNT_0013457987 /DNA_START=167 /DNA_END=982 /DNA_ORIENTATION=+
MDYFLKGRPNCEWDSKFHFTHFRRKTLVYGRANAPARWVQVAESVDMGASWGKFKPITIQGSLPELNNTHVYFMVVTAFFDRAAQKPRLAALFPGIVNGERAGVHLAFSDNGYDFTPPVLIMESEFAYDNEGNMVWSVSNRSGSLKPTGFKITKEIELRDPKGAEACRRREYCRYAAARTPDHPVALHDLGEQGAVLVVQHDVQIHGSMNTKTYFCRYIFDGGWADIRRNFISGPSKHLEPVIPVGTGSRQKAPFHMKNADIALSGGLRTP